MQEGKQGKLEAVHVVLIRKGKDRKNDYRDLEKCNGTKHNEIPESNMDILMPELAKDFCYREGAVIEAEEDLETEFKSFANARELGTSIPKQAAKYICAFLNANGGNLFYGVHDNGVITGLVLNRVDRDLMRNELDTILYRFSPSVNAELCSLQFHPVIKIGRAEFDPSSNLFLAHFTIKKGSESIYMDPFKKAWIKMHGSCREMTVDMIKERLEIQNNKKLDERVASEVEKALEKYMLQQSLLFKSAPVISQADVAQNSTNFYPLNKPTASVPNLVSEKIPIATPHQNNLYLNPLKLVNHPQSPDEMSIDSSPNSPVNQFLSILPQPLPISDRSKFHDTSNDCTFSPARKLVQIEAKAKVDDESILQEVNVLSYCMNLGFPEVDALHAIKMLKEEGALARDEYFHELVVDRLTNPISIEHHAFLVQMNSFKNMIPIETRPKRLKCTFCVEVFESQFALEVHEKSCKYASLLPCAYCQKPLARNFLQQHEIRCYSNHHGNSNMYLKPKKIGKLSASPVKKRKVESIGLQENIVMTPQEYTQSTSAWNHGHQRPVEEELVPCEFCNARIRFVDYMQHTMRCDRSKHT